MVSFNNTAWLDYYYGVISADDLIGGLVSSFGGAGV